MEVGPRRSLPTQGRLLHLVDETARAVSPKIRQVTAAYAETRQRVWVAHSGGSLRR